MKTLKAKINLTVDGKLVKEGETFELADARADKNIEMGYAEEVKGKPDTKEEKNFK